LNDERQREIDDFYQKQREMELGKLDHEQKLIEERQREIQMETRDYQERRLRGKAPDSGTGDESYQMSDWETDEDDSSDYEDDDFYDYFTNGGSVENPKIPHLDDASDFDDEENDFYDQNERKD